MHDFIYLFILYDDIIIIILQRLLWIYRERLVPKVKGKTIHLDWGPSMNHSLSLTIFHIILATNVTHVHWKKNANKWQWDTGKADFTWVWTYSLKINKLKNEGDIAIFPPFGVGWMSQIITCIHTNRHQEKNKYSISFLVVHYYDQRQRIIYHGS